MQVTKMQKGLADMFSLAAGGRQGYDDTYQETMKNLAQGKNYLSSAKKNAALADIYSDQLNARRSVPDLVSSSALLKDLDPRLASTLLRASDMSKPAAIFDMIAGNQQNNARDRAMGQLSSMPADMSSVAAFNAIASGNAVPDIYSQNADGQVLNQFTGANGQTPLSAANIYKNIAQGDQFQAHAGAYNSQAGLYDAQAAQVPIEAFSNGTVVDTRPMFTPAEWQGVPYDMPAPGQSSMPVIHAPPGGSAGGIDPTTAARKQAELEAQGYPRELAAGVAYGTIVSRQDPVGMSTIFINTLTGQEVGRIDSKGNLVWGGQMQPGGAPGSVDFNYVPGQGLVPANPGSTGGQSGRNQ